MQKHIVIDARIRRSSTGRYVDRLVEHLQAIDQLNRYTILVQPDDPWEPKAPNFYREDSKYAQFSLNPMQQIGFSWQLYRLRPDLVHFPLNNQPLLYWGRTMVSTLDLTMLYYTRPGKTPLPIFWVKMALFRLLFWFSNRKAKAVITISNYVKDELAKKYSFIKDKMTNTYCAAEPPLEIAAVKPTFAHNSQLKTQNFLLYVGTAFPHKNLDQLIKAFEILNTSQPELNLVLVGKKEQYYTKLEQATADSPARSSIVFTGFIPDQELKWLYQNAQAYVFPSLSEGFGLPGLEAMVHNCPVVSSNATCLPEIYEDAAVYFDPNNPEDMASKITSVITSQKLKKSLVQKGHAQAAKFSWRRMAEQTAEVYHSVLKG